MVNPITAARRDLARLLTGVAGNTWDHMPDRITPPGVAVTPPLDTTWAEPGDTPGTLLMSLDVWVFVPIAPNAEATDQLSDAVIAVVTALSGTTDFWVTRVGEPALTVGTPMSVLGAPITVQTLIHID
jgi:hypothetical protein